MLCLVSVSQLFKTNLVRLILEFPCLLTVDKNALNFLLGIGLIGGSIFASAGLTFWFGAREYVENGVESGTVVSVRSNISHKNFKLITSSV